MVNKVFGIGFQKTGTSTLRSALEVLDFSVKGGGRELVKPLLRGEIAPVYDVVDKFDAFEDHPWPMLYKDLDEKYPGSKFILTLRDDDSWLKSVVNHLGFLPDEMQTLTYGFGAPLGYEDMYLEKYQTHNRDVLAYFKDRPQDLLVIDFSNGASWEKLCAFLFKDIPDAPFPHENKRSYHNSTRMLQFPIRLLIGLFRR